MSRPSAPILSVSKPSTSRSDQNIAKSYHDNAMHTAPRKPPTTMKYINKANIFEESSDNLERKKSQDSSTGYTGT
jgi:hypothetical protein